MTPKASGSWQLRCTHPYHQGEGAACIKTRANTFEGGAEAAIRMLKSWALHGLLLESKTEHKEVWDLVEGQFAAGTLPSMAELDAQVIESWTGVLPS